MGHAVDDLAHAQLAAILDDRLERGNHRLAAIEAEALGADVFLAEEGFVLFAADHCGEDRLLAFGGELDRVFGGLELVLQETAFFRIRDVHVFEADIAAIGCAQRVIKLADLDPFEAEHAADIDLAAFLSVETVPFERQVLGHLAMRQAQRIEIGGQMAAHAIEPDEQHGADRIVRRLLDRLGVERLARLLRRLRNRRTHLRGVERGGQIRPAVDHFGEPFGVAPARARLRAFLVTHFGKEIVAFVTHPGHLSRADLLSALYGNASAARTVPGRRGSAPNVRRVPSTVRRAWCRVRSGSARRGCPHLPWPRSCRRRRPGRPRRWRPRDPCGGPEAPCGRR